MTKLFSTDAARRAFDDISEAAEGHDNLSLFEACGTLLSQVIASGSFDLASARDRAIESGLAMAADIGANWDKVVDQRKARRQ